MSVTAKALIQSKFAASSLTTEYTAPVNTRAIIDKMTATNSDSNTRTISVHLVPSGSTADSSNIVLKTYSLVAGETYDITEVKNHVLDSGGFISVVASASSTVVIRASGREVT